MENQLHGVSLLPQVKFLNKKYLKTKDTGTAGEVLWYFLNNVLYATWAEYEWEVNQYVSAKLGEQSDKFSHQDRQFWKASLNLGRVLMVYWSLRKEYSWTFTPLRVHKMKVLWWIDSILLVSVCFCWSYQ